MSTTPITCRHHDTLLGLRAEIAATGVLETAAEAAHDTSRLAALQNHERQLWDALVHLVELGGDQR